MPTPRELRFRAKDCRQLADSANELFVKTALGELAQDLDDAAGQLERRGREGPFRARRRLSH
jgi:hypothetical protein